MTIAPSRWTAGPVAGKRAADSKVRHWTEEDAERLRRRGEVMTPYGPFKVGGFGRLIAGDRCGRCHKAKIIKTRAAGTWCYGCGRAVWD